MSLPDIPAPTMHTLPMSLVGSLGNFGRSVSFEALIYSYSSVIFFAARRLANRDFQDLKPCGLVVDMDTTVCGADIFSQSIDGLLLAKRVITEAKEIIEALEERRMVGYLYQEGDPSVRSLTDLHVDLQLPYTQSRQPKKPMACRPELEKVSVLWQFPLQRQFSICERPLIQIVH